MDQAEVTVGAKNDRGGLTTCGRAMQRRTAAARLRQLRWGGGSGSSSMHKVEKEARRS